jgi:hypothetical protein
MDEKSLYKEKKNAKGSLKALGHEIKFKYLDKNN